MNILQRYVLREMVGPVFLSVLFFTFVLLLAQVFRLAELLLEARVGWAILIEFLLSIAISLIFLTIPMAALLGTLTAIGRLTSENELLAMRVGGLSLIRVFWPVFFLALLGSLFLVWAGFFVTPQVFANLRSKETEVQFRLLTNLEPGRNYGNLAPRGTDLFLFFDQRLPRQPGDGDYVLRMGSVAMRVVGQDNQFGNQRMIDWDALPRNEAGEIIWPEPSAEFLAPQETVVFASSGTIIGDLETRTIELQLNDGVILPLNRVVIDRETGAPLRREGIEQTTVIRFDRLTDSISPRREERRLDELDARQLTLAELRELTALAPTGEMFQEGPRRRLTREWQTYLDARNELLQRLSLPFSLLAFVLIAVPLAVELRPRAKTVSFLIAIGLILLYYTLITFANSLGQTNSPLTIPMFFFPNLLIGGVGVFLFWRVQR